MECELPEDEINTNLTLLLLVCETELKASTDPGLSYDHRNVILKELEKSILKHFGAPNESAAQTIKIYNHCLYKGFNV